MCVCVCVCVCVYNIYACQSQGPRGLRRRSAAARLLRSWVRIPAGAWMSYCCECCVLGRGLCDALITRPEESYRLWCVVVCDLETSRMRRSWLALGRKRHRNIYIYIYIYIYNSLIHSFFPQSALRQVHSIFEIEFSTQCDLALPLSLSDVFSIR